MEDDANWTSFDKWNNTELEDAGDDGAAQVNITRHIYKYATPMFLTTGIAVNCLTILLVNRMGIAKTSTNMFMFLTAILNVSALLSGLFIVYLSWVWNVEFRTVGSTMCMCLTLLRDATLGVSIWCVVGFTVYRYVVVCTPMKRTDLSESGTAVLFCTVTLLLVIARHAYLLWTVGIHNGHCGVLPPYEDFHRNVRPWIDVIVDVILPVSVVTFCNVLMVFSLTSHVVSSQQMQLGQETQTNTAVVYLVVALGFYLCLAPVIVTLLLAPNWAPIQHIKPLQAVKNHLIYVHHLAYFFLYCMTGGAMRRELRRFYSESRQSCIDLVNCCRWCRLHPKLACSFGQREVVDFVHRSRADQEARL